VGDGDGDAEGVGDGGGEVALGAGELGDGNGVVGSGVGDGGGVVGVPGSPGTGSCGTGGIAAWPCTEGLPVNMPTGSGCLLARSRWRGGDTACTRSPAAMLGEAVAGASVSAGPVRCGIKSSRATMLQRMITDAASPTAVPMTTCRSLASQCRHVLIIPRRRPSFVP
jgi:hypothetical protein